MNASLSSARRSLLGGLLGATLIGAAHATPVYDSNGFESPLYLLEQPLDGQDAAPVGNGPWQQDNGGSTAVVTGINTLEGTGSVKITKAPGAAGDTRWGVVKSVTPDGLDNVVEVSFEMKVIRKPNEYGPLFGIEAYDNSSGTPKLIGSLLHDAGNGELVCQQAATGAFVGTGVHPDLAFHHHFKLTLNFSARTYSVHVDGQRVHTEGFVDSSATVFTDAPLVTLTAGTNSEDGIAYLDNYRIDHTTSQLPYLLWQGDDTGNVWDAGVSANWFDGISPIEFINGDDVRFEDGGSAAPAIQLSGSLFPDSVLVSASQDYEFAGSGAISGATGLTKEGSGTLTIGNANTYAGDTEIASGELSVGNASGSATGSGTVTILPTGILSGNGSIGGPVEVANGAIVAPGAGIGTLSLGDSLFLDDASLQFELGTSSDQIVVAGDVTVGGTLDITDAGGFGPGSYPLITYGGALTEASLIVGNAPAGFDYDIDTSTPGAVTLVVNLPPPPPAAPDNLAAAPAGIDTIDLTWSDLSDDEDAFVIERARGNGEFSVVASTGADTTSYSDSGLSSGSTYAYRVRATNAGGTSGYSNTASARTDLSPAVALYEYELTTLDSSGNNQHGAPVGTVLYDEGWVGDYAATFNGTAFVEIQRVVEENFTVAMWIKTTGDASGGSWYNGMGLVDGEMVGGTSDWGCSVLNSKFAFGVGAPDSTLLSKRSINDGGWHHVAATRDSDSGEVRIYIDGTLDISEGLPTGPRTAPTQLRIGATQSNPPVFFTGAMDDLRFYDGVLTGEEIGELAGVPAPPPPPTGDPAVVWPLGDSITWGYTTLSAADSPGGYREPLYRNLLLNGMDDIQFVGANTANPGPLLTRDSQINHDGYPQYTITEINNNLDGNINPGKTRFNNYGYWLTGGGVRPALDPDIVLLLAGTNDIGSGTPEVIESRMNGMVGKIFSLRPDTTIYLASIPPFPANAGGTAVAKAYNQLLLEKTVPKYLAAGFDIRWVDQYPNFVIAPDGPDGDVINSALYGDTIHPNEAGYQLMGDTWAAALLAAPLPPPAAPTDLVAVSVTDDGITLQWSDQSSNEGVFIIQRTLDGVNFETIGYVNPGVTSFTDTRVGGGTTYGYRIVARNSGGDSTASNYLTVTANDRPLTAYLKFDESEGTTAIDSSPNGNDGTLVGAPVWTAGKIGNALDLNGSGDHVTLPQGFVQGLNDFTVASWVKIDSLNNWARVFDFGSGVTNYMFLTTRSSTKGTMRFAMLTPNSGGEQGIDAPMAMPVGEWAHVAVTLHGSTATLYLNGEEVGSNDAMTLTPASLGSTTQNYIGKSQWNDPYLNGAVDDFQVHDRALGPDEVQMLYELTNPGIIPSAPTGLAVVAGDGQTDLSWSAVDGADTYAVYRAEGSGYVLIANGLTDLSFTDTGLTNGTSYSYVLTASNANGESGYSDATEATPIPEAHYGGRAYVAGVTALGSETTWTDTGSLPDEGGSSEASALTLDEAGVLAGEIGHAFVLGQADRTRAEATVASLSIDVGGVLIESDFLMARALAAFQAGTTGLAGGSEVANLIVAGVPVTITGETNQVVNLPLVGQVVIDEQVTTGTSITVNALHITLSTGEDIVVASASAAYESIEQPPAIGDDQVSGGGWIADANGDKIGNFSLSGGYEDGVLFGDLNFKDKATGMKVKASSVTAYGYGPNANSRQLEGTCEIDGTDGYTFVAVAEDNGEPGDADTFSLDLSTGYHSDGTLGGGNIQVHVPGQ